MAACETLSVNRSDPNSSSSWNTSVNPSVYSKIRAPGPNGNISAEYVIPGSIPSGVPEASTHADTVVRQNQRPRIMSRIDDLDRPFGQMHPHKDRRGHTAAARLLALFPMLLPDQRHDIRQRYRLRHQRPHRSPKTCRHNRRSSPCQLRRPPPSGTSHPATGPYRDSPHTDLIASRSLRRNRVSRNIRHIDFGNSDL